MAYEGTGSRSGNRTFSEILKQRRSRHEVLAGGLATAASAFSQAAWRSQRASLPVLLSGPRIVGNAPNGDVYCTLTNNSGRTTADAANPLAPNEDGHIIRWRDTDRHVGTSFTWDIYLIAEDTHGTEQSFSDPDGLWADPDGRLFIQTDGGQQDGLNNQMLVADPATGDLRRLFTGVTDCEITGIAVTPNRRTMFVNVQHPGNGDPTLTNFPALPDGLSVPRDATVVISRKGGGVIGS